MASTPLSHLSIRKAVVTRRYDYDTILRSGVTRTSCRRVVGYLSIKFADHQIMLVENLAHS